MGDIAFLIWNITSATLTIWIIHRYLQVFFIPKKCNVLTIVTNFSFFLHQLEIGYHNIEPIIVLIFNICLVWLIALSGYHKTKKSKLLYTVLLYAIWMILEIAVYFFLKIIQIKDVEFTILGSVISKFLAIIMIGIIKHKFFDPYFKSVPVIELIKLQFIPVCSIFISHIIFINGNNQVDTLIVYSLLVFINIMIFEIYQKLSDSILVHREKVAFEQQISLLTKNTEDKQRTMDSFYEESHNLKNQFIVIQEYLKQHRLKEVEELLNQIICQSNISTENVVYSGNDIVDAIINSKYNIAQEMGIHINLSIFLPDKLCVQQCELGLIVGNLLDNALEATAKCNPNGKIIYVAMMVKKEELVIVVKNPYINKLLKSKTGNLLSTKNGVHHGYGISSIKKVIEKYQGEMLIETDNGVFEVTIVLNNKSPKQ